MAGKRRQDRADVGMIGLAVMGRNLALNMADHGYAVAAFNRNTSVMQEFVSGNPDTPGGLIACGTLRDLVDSLERPRRIVMLIKSGPPVDAVIGQLRPLLDRGDVVVDGGNSLWTDTIRRERELAASGIHFVGSGVSGGEEGARFGPSLMPGGSREAWRAIRPIWRAIAARVDRKTGKPLDGAAPGRPVKGGEPCAAHIGPDGAGHYVKMVHNGIEYADMQLICEAYHLLRHLRGRSRLLPHRDLRGHPAAARPRPTAPVPGGRRAGRRGSKGYGQVDQHQRSGHGRRRSHHRRGRIREDHQFVQGPAGCRIAQSPRAAVRVQGLPEGSDRGGARRPVCLQGLCLRTGLRVDDRGSRRVRLEVELRRDRADLAGRLHHPRTFPSEDRGRLPARSAVAEPAARSVLPSQGTRRTGQLAQGRRARGAGRASRPGVHERTRLLRRLPHGRSSRAAVLPASLLQAQRDYFGAHTYERTDRPRGRRFHLDWPHPERPQVEI